MRSQDVTIRLIATGDSIAELTALLHRAYRPLAEMGLRFLATHQEEEVTRQRMGQGECYVALLEGRLVGTILFRAPLAARGTPWYERPEVASFGQLAVEPALQGRGIGARLINLVERRALEVGASEIALDTSEQATHLIALYTRRGYRFIEHVEWELTNYRSVVLSRRLA